jgi:hypothetical protein
MSKNKNPGNENSGRSKRDIEGLTHDALRALGWLVPQSLADVERAEQEMLANPLPLPEVLADPYQVFENLEQSRRPVLKLQVPSTPAVEDALARVAREGGQISPEVEEQMQRDRRAAEQKAHGK